jgi:hypothetical protein
MEMKEEIINLIKEDTPKVEQYNDIKNQFIIYGKGWTLFQSYKSPIVLKKEGKTYIFRDWDYSTTTGKYRNMFLMETKAETLKKLKSGEYIAVDFEVI